MSFKETLKILIFFDIIMLRCVLKKSKNMSLIFFSNCAFSVKTLFN